MYYTINTWLRNPIFYRFGFGILMTINILFITFNIGEEHLYIFYVLATIFLGIGFYDRSPIFLVILTTFVVMCRFFHAYESHSIVNFFILEITYILILYVSVGFMRKSQKIKEDHLELILALSKALDSRDTYTSDHSHNVAEYATKIAMKMELPKDLLEAIRKGGLLHDIGKIGIPESILLKPGGLTKEEYAIIKNHPLIGFEMIKHVEEFKNRGILDIVLYHHERYDGKGYPKGLKGNEIPLVARIIAIADTFDALTSNRTYSSKDSIESALLEIKRNKGTQFDPEITDAFLSLYEKTNEERSRTEAS